MATGTTEAIPTYGEVTGITSNCLHTVGGNNYGTIWAGGSPYNYSAYTKYDLLMFDVSPQASSSLSGKTLNIINPYTDDSYYPKFILITHTGATSFPLLTTSAASFTIASFQSSTATTQSTTKVYGPIPNNILFGYFGNGQYIPL